jgi:predicted rRNA methylase YqxC with S4 and FtsJ domains
MRLDATALRSGRLAGIQSAMAAVQRNKVIAENRQVQIYQQAMHDSSCIERAH